MKKNMGSADKAVRVAVAIVIAVLYFTNTITGVLGIVLLALASVFLITSLVGFCPLYLPFGIRTRKSEDALPGKQCKIKQSDIYQPGI